MHFSMDIHCRTCLNLGHTFSVRGLMNRMGEMKGRRPCFTDMALAPLAFETIRWIHQTYLVRLRNTATLHRS